jgi:hypothetical protein
MNSLTPTPILHQLAWTLLDAPAKQIALSNGRVVLVDARDFAYLNQWRWHYLRPSAGTGSGYAWRCVGPAEKRIPVFMHRVILERHGAVFAEGLCTDHVNRDGLDNRLANLRVVTFHENNMNRAPFPPFSEEHRAKISAALRGKPFTAEHRRNLSLAAKARSAVAQ